MLWEGDDIVAGHNHCFGQIYIARGDCPHALESTAFKRDHKYSIRSSCFGKNREWRKILHMNFDRFLSINKLLNEGIFCSVCACTFNIQGLESLANSTCNRKIFNPGFRCKAGAQRWDNLRHHFNPTYMIAHNCRRRTKTTFRNTRVLRRLFRLVLSLFIHRPKILFIKVHLFSRQPLINK